MSRLVPLTQGKFAIVDDADYDRVIQHKWYLMRMRHFERAAAWINDHNVYLHNFILGVTGVDHINGDCLNNTRHNLRIASNKENSSNRTKSENKSSQYKGVSRVWSKKRKPWRAYIRHNYKLTYLGYFETEEEAAMAYNEKAVELFGEFAKLNKVKVTM